MGTRRLYLLRHWIAVPHVSPDFAEDDRPLTSKGVQHIRQVARGLKRLNVKLDRIVSSPLPRAARTAEIVAETLGLSDRLCEEDALRSGRDGWAIREWLDGQTDGRLMIVGHNPGLSDLAGLLLTGETPLLSVALRKGAVAAFVQTGGPNRWGLDWLARPRILRQR